MATIQIRTMNKRQRAILDQFKEDHNIKTDSGAICKLIEYFKEFKERTEELFDAKRQLQNDHDRLRYLSQQLLMSKKGLANSFTELDKHLNNREEVDNG